MPSQNTKVHVIARSSDGTLSSDSSVAGTYEALEGLNINYATVMPLEALGVTVARGHVSAGKSVPPHAGDTNYALYVLSGTGHLTLCDDNGKETGRIAFAPGDLIVFPPHAQHGWINGGEDMEWLGIDFAKS